MPSLPFRPLLAIRQASSSSSSPSTSTTTTTSTSADTVIYGSNSPEVLPYSSEYGDGPVPPGALIGVAFCVFFVLALGTLACMLWRSREKKRRRMREAEAGAAGDRKPDMNTADNLNSAYELSRPKTPHLAHVREVKGDASAEEEFPSFQPQPPPPPYQPQQQRGVETMDGAGAVVGSESSAREAWRDAAAGAPRRSRT